ncbi:MAG: hypothetical protein JJV89_02030 [Desulfosarcina sp.]|nr:hypothetical protein [Desulfobacterales bacterium]
MAWLSGGWGQRIKITIDADEVATSESNVPVAVYLSASSGIDSDDVSCVFDELTSDANRFKIAVTTSDGTTQCYCEIELWDDANEKAWVHIKLPSVSSSTDTDFYLYYDSSHADNTTYIGDADGGTVAQNVWDSNFGLVHHMNQDPSGGSAAIKDSTSNNNDSTSVGTMLTGDLVSSKFGKGIDFDSSDDVLTNSTPHPGGDTEITFEMLMKPASFPSGTDREVLMIFEEDLDPGKTTIVKFNFYGSQVRFAIKIDTTVIRVTQVAALSTGNWYYICGKWKSGEIVSLSVNGTETNTAGTYSGVIADCINGLQIGGWQYPSRYADVNIDEVRFSTCRRSDAWANITHKGLTDALLTFGQEILASDVEANTLLLNFTQKDITVSGSQVIFPVAIPLKFGALTSEVKIDTAVSVYTLRTQFLFKAATIIIPTVIWHDKPLDFLIQINYTDVIADITSFFYHDYLNAIGLKTHDLITDSIKCCLLLSTYTPDVANHYRYVDVSGHEIAANGGYASGGVVLIENEIFNSGNTSFFRSALPYWDSFSANVQYAVLYNDSLPNKNLICYFEIVGGITVSTPFALTLPGRGFIGMKAQA